jgi:hypothetical protein
MLEVSQRTVKLRTPTSLHRSKGTVLRPSADGRRVSRRRGAAELLQALEVPVEPWRAWVSEEWQA